MRKMKRKAVKCVSMAMSAVMLGALVTGCGKQEVSTNTPSNTKSETAAEQSNTVKEEAPVQKEVEITVFGSQYGPADLGPQYDVIANKIAEDTGVRISCAERDTGTDEAELLSTMMASNDLPDIIFVPNSDLMDQLIEAGQVLELSDYWNEENCPNLCGATPDVAQRQDYVANEKFDGKRYQVVMWGGTGAENQPTVGFYVPWEVYSKAGYPQVNSLDDLVDAIEAMQKASPENQNGMATYGTGAWFADEGSWGSWCVDQVAMCLGYVCDSYVYTFDVANRTILDQSPITDPDSVWWQAMKFYFDLNQRGLLDPDSITQKNDQWIEKASSSQYMMIMPGWETAGLKDKTGMSYVGLKPFTDATICDWSNEFSGAGYAISSTCKYPEKALQLLDYLCSPEGCRIAFSGIEGEAWEMIDGKAQYTQQRIDDAKTLSDTEMVKKYGQTLGQFVGYALNVISPLDNSTFDLTYTPEYRESLMTDAERDALKYYGVDSIREIYTKNTKTVKLVLAEYNNKIPSYPDELAKNLTDLQNFVYRNYLNCIYAKSEAEFEAQKQVIIDGAADYNIDGLYQWYKEHFDSAKETVDTYLN